MSLKVQINLILISILFGSLFSLYLRFLYPYIKKQKKYVYYFLSFFTVFNFSLLYFVILQKINNGILHIYAFLCIIIGFLLEHTLHSLLDNHIKKWYTLLIDRGD